MVVSANREHTPGPRNRTDPGRLPRDDNDILSGTLCNSQPRLEIRLSMLERICKLWHSHTNATEQ